MHYLCTYAHNVISLLGLMTVCCKAELCPIMAFESLCDYDNRHTAMWYTNNAYHHSSLCAHNSYFCYWHCRYKIEGRAVENLDLEILGHCFLTSTPHERLGNSHAGVTVGDCDVVCQLTPYQYEYSTPYVETGESSFWVMGNSADRAMAAFGSNCSMLRNEFASD